MSEPSNPVDRIAIVLSGACLIHCLALPASVLFIPAVTSTLSASETVIHWVLLALAVPVSTWALYRGYRRHRAPLALTMGGIGLTLMLLAVTHIFGLSSELPLTMLGASLVTVAHIINMRRNHAIAPAHSHG